MLRRVFSIHSPRVEKSSFSPLSSCHLCDENLSTSKSGNGTIFFKFQSLQNFALSRFDCAETSKPDDWWLALSISWAYIWVWVCRGLLWYTMLVKLPKMKQFPWTSRSSTTRVLVFSKWAVLKIIISRPVVHTIKKYLQYCFFLMWCNYQLSSSKISYGSISCFYKSLLIKDLASCCLQGKLDLAQIFEATQFLGLGIRKETARRWENRLPIKDPLSSFSRRCNLQNLPPTL